MPSLTPQLLENFPYSEYADPQSIQRGRAYCKDGNTWSVELITKSEAVILVDGNSGKYIDEIEVDQKGQLLFNCDCPYADEGNFCKHMIAAALELSEYLKDEEDFDKGEDNIIQPPPLPTATGRANSKKRLPSHCVKCSEQKPDIIDCANIR